MKSKDDKRGADPSLVLELVVRLQWLLLVTFLGSVLVFIQRYHWQIPSHIWLGKAIGYGMVMTKLLL